MADYSRILLAVDLTEDSEPVSNRAARLATLSAAELHIVHVIEPLSLAYGGDVPMDLSTVQDRSTSRRGRTSKSSPAGLASRSSASILFSAVRRARFSARQKRSRRT